ncbi:tape measure protein [Atlantibacter hermannii]|uniref:tape measure protein n=1 Tax=Atlantibacter hermannii TaxID=565 RepID=UPI0028A091BE|nr:tape measure protein [Atlantibacter hermannii]HEE0093348.1 tape measure protein [Citrobacter braakii]HEE9916501.1 tape measure protein [Citrobacter braakii]
MTDQSADLVTKIDVIPDLDGLNSFDAAIDRAISKVNQLDAAIKRVNNLKPASPYAPSGSSSAPTLATTAAVTAIAATGANLISRTPLAEAVRKEAQKVARAATQGMGNGVAGYLPSPHGRSFAGGGMALPGGRTSKLLALPAPGSADFSPAPTPKPVIQRVIQQIVPARGGGITAPPPAGGGGGAGLPPRGGGLVDPHSPGGNPFARFDVSAGRFSGEPAPGEPAPNNGSGGEGAGGSGFGMETLIGGAGLTAGVIAFGRALADDLDAIQRQQAQIARLAQTTGDAKDAWFELNQAASEMRSDSGSFISTYTNMATATQKLGLSQEETIEATKGLVGALQLGGGSAEAVNAALYQMGQAFSSDRFSGDEFRSFMEAIGTMAPEVAKAFGTDVKGLRKMSEDGKLTAETMIKAFQKMAVSNMDLLKKQGWTWGQTMTVMGNDWQVFLAKATIGGDWQKFTDWAANTLIPLVRRVESEVAEMWSSLADESKTAILIGILGAVGAAFTALAIPVLAAIWPFLAVGAAVWLVYEAFVEWEAWLNGVGGTIFDGLFGSFDEFEKRYPAIVRMLKALAGWSDSAANNIDNNGAASPEERGVNVWKELANPYNLFGNAFDFLKSRGNDFNPLTGIEKFLNFLDGNDATTAIPPKSVSGANIVNNVNNKTEINVNSPREAAETVNNLSNPGTIEGGLSDNMAEVSGAR